MANDCEKKKTYDERTTVKEKQKVMADTGKDIHCHVFRISYYSLVPKLHQEETPCILCFNEEREEQSPVSQN